MNIQDQLQDFIAYFSGDNTRIDLDDFSKLGLNGELKHYKSGQFIINQGQLAPKIYFLIKGSVRYLSLSEDGKEFTQSFASAPGIAGSTRAMTRKTKALFSIEVLEREYAFVQQTAEQRYLNFLAENRQLGDKLPLKMIASHIGITPIALSRIRKKLK